MNLPRKCRRSGANAEGHRTRARMPNARSTSLCCAKTRADQHEHRAGLSHSIIAACSAKESSGHAPLPMATGPQRTRTRLSNTFWPRGRLSPTP
jgi:hypothetical protein